MCSGKKLVIVLMVLFAVSFCSATVYYVDVDATGSDNGSSWTDAYNDMQDGLTAATSGDEVWVAEGEYKPGTSRTDSFEPDSGVELYGGFNPDTGDDTWVERDYVTNVTILSGDIGTIDDNSDNCIHIVNILQEESVVIDGFTVTKGYADDSPYDSEGGGINGTASSITVENCIFTDNDATSMGAAVYGQGASTNITIINCTFTDNTVGDGGGIRFWRSRLRLLVYLYNGHRLHFYRQYC